ncbi:hypothetical protein PCANC_20241 [Puccinia coronata f. sp. avenae]|uniref:Uncharacterized protein n=1 Tax=Puccinia coronata f. sp. avenae TaxID=200324 RepID=A0A2N5SF53_9BASI|nr:hypothetical protein PCANC_20241 [Puccinia coronata f. sp. avenae]PLW43842.1 hypothetical protein PCASD_05793 [Puccinia coronata f. sp. avenae]
MTSGEQAQTRKGLTDHKWRKLEAKSHRWLGTCTKAGERSAAIVGNTIQQAGTLFNTSALSSLTRAAERATTRNGSKTFLLVYGWKALCAFTATAMHSLAYCNSGSALRPSILEFIGSRDIRDADLELNEPTTARQAMCHASNCQWSIYMDNKFSYCGVTEARNHRALVEKKVDDKDHEYTEHQPVSYW